MSWSTLTTTIVSGVLAVALIASVTVLLVTGNDVPSSFETLLTMSAGVAVGGSVLASRGGNGGA